MAKFTEFTYSMDHGWTSSHRKLLPTSGVSYNSPEIKYFDTCVSEFVIPLVNDGGGNAWDQSECDPSILNTLYAPTLGNSRSQRIGRQTYVDYIHIRGFIEDIIPLQTTADNWGPTQPTIIRFILYLDTQSNGDRKQGSDIISSVASPDRYHILDHQNANQMKHIILLKDQTFQSRNYHVYQMIDLYVGSSTFSHYFENIIEFNPPLLVNHISDTGTVDDIQDNSFHCLCSYYQTQLVNDPRPPGPLTYETIPNYPQLSYRCRVAFHDQ